MGTGVPDMDYLLRDYFRVSQHLNRLFRRHFKQWDITFPQALALSVLDRCGPMPISKLAERTGSANSTTSCVVDRLETLGLARRIRSGNDRRVILVEVGEAYATLKEEATIGVEEYFSALLGRLDPEERNHVAQGMSIMEKALLLADDND